MAHDSPTATGAAAPAAEAPPPPRCLHIWVVGNPTSGGMRGAVVLQRIEDLFQETFGAETVRSTSSTVFLQTVSTNDIPHRGNSGSTTACDNANAPADEVASPHTSDLGTRCHKPLASLGIPLKRPPPPETAASAPSSASASPVIQMCIIRTDREGHARAVSKALGASILRTRLADEEEGERQHCSKQNVQRSETQSIRAAGTRNSSMCNRGQTAVPFSDACHAITSLSSGAIETPRNSSPSPTSSPSSSHASVDGTVELPSQKYVVVIVGGDGTLSEVTNGLCEGSLDAFAAYKGASPSPLDGDGNAGTTALSSHAVVEREAAVLSLVLPAVIYVPGGTGVDFAKLRLCCPTPESVLVLVRDGLLTRLFPPRAATQGGMSKDTRVGDTAAESSGYFPCDAAAFSPVCAAYPVDIGRIEFLRTGTRHFFINECSIGMSCDVIQRCERFKRRPWIAALGGLFLFAASAFVSLLHMRPKPLYVCKLPARVSLFAAAPSKMHRESEENELVKHSGEVKRLRDPVSTPFGSRGDAEGGGWVASPCGASAAAPASPGGALFDVASHTPFMRISEPLCRVRERSAPHGTRPLPPYAGGPSTFNDPARATQSPSCSAGLTASYAAPTDAVAYARYEHIPIPPPQAHIVRFSSQAPKSSILPFLDISPDEFETHRRRQQQQQLTTGCRAGVSPSIRDRRSSTGAVDANNGVAKVGGRNRGRHAVKMEGWDGVTCRANAGGVDGTAAPNSLYYQALSRDGDGDDDLASLTWVEMPSSMIAFANGCWYGGGMYVAPHGSPIDGLLSCTSWVATICPFILGLLSLYTGKHVHWSSTNAFDGARFLIAAVPSVPNRSAVEPQSCTKGQDDALYVEADGEVLEAVPAIVEVSGKLTFIVPATSAIPTARPAPGTTREYAGAATENHLPHGSPSRIDCRDGETRGDAPMRKRRNFPEGLLQLCRRAMSTVQCQLTRDKKSCAAETDNGAPRGDCYV